MRGHDDIKTVAINEEPRAEWIREDRQRLHVLIDQMYDQIERKIVPVGFVKVSIKSTGMYRAIVGKGGVVLDDGWDATGKVFLRGDKT